MRCFQQLKAEDQLHQERIADLEQIETDLQIRLERPISASDPAHVCPVAPTQALKDAFTVCTNQSALIQKYKAELAQCVTQIDALTLKSQQDAQIATQRMAWESSNRKKIELNWPLRY